MLNKVCFVAKTKMMVWDGVDEPMEFCAQNDDQEPILFRGRMYLQTLLSISTLET